MRRPFFLIPVQLSLVLALLAPVEQVESQRSHQRSMPPEILECDRNDLTSYNGALMAYTPHNDFTLIEIATEWDTIEAVRVPHSAEHKIEAAFTIHGEAFKPEHWAELGALDDNRLPTKGTQLIAWVCLDGETPPIIDWRP